MNNQANTINRLQNIDTRYTIKFKVGETVMISARTINPVLSGLLPPFKENKKLNLL